MSDNNRFQNARVKNALDNPKLRLYGKNEQGKSANISWNIFSNMPRCTVWTGVDGDKDNGKITGNFDTMGFYTLLEGLKQAIAFKPTEEKKEFRNKVELMRPNWKPGGGKPDGIVKASELWYGKDAEGRVWISLTAYNRPAIKFIIQVNEYHRFCHASGEALSEAEGSVLAAQGYVRLLEMMMAHLQVVEYKEPEKRDNNQRSGGGNSGGYRGNSGGGNGAGASSAPAASTDDYDSDLPF